LAYTEDIMTDVVNRLCDTSSGLLKLTTKVAQESVDQRELYVDHAKALNETKDAINTDLEAMETEQANLNQGIWTQLADVDDRLRKLEGRRRSQRKKKQTVKQKETLSSK
jgi:hypothetical protein